MAEKNAKEKSNTKVTKSEVKEAEMTRKRRVAARARERTRAEFGGFVEFIRTQGVVGLAIGFVIGAQAKALVDQLSLSFINPLLGLILGGTGALTSKELTIVVAGREAKFLWGAFLFAVINFLILAAIIYFTFKWLKLDKLDKKKE